MRPKRYHYIIVNLGRPTEKYETELTQPTDIESDTWFEACLTPPDAINKAKWIQGGNQRQTAAINKKAIST